MTDTVDHEHSTCRRRAAREAQNAELLRRRPKAAETALLEICYLDFEHPPALENTYLDDSTDAQPERPTMTTAASTPSNHERTTTVTQTTPIPAPTDREHGSVPIDTGRILIVDPVHLPVDLVAALLDPPGCRCGKPHAVMLWTPAGDGPHYVDSETFDGEAVLTIAAPYGDLFGRGWTDATE